MDPSSKKMLHNALDRGEIKGCGPVKMAEGGEVEAEVDEHAKWLEHALSCAHCGQFFKGGEAGKATEDLEDEARPEGY